MLLSLVRSSSSLKQEQHISLNLQGIPRSPSFKDKAHILLASLRSIPDKNCCVLASFQHDDAMVIQAFSYSELVCSSVFWLRIVCWALVCSTHRSLRTRLVSMGRTAYCGDWAKCKELCFTFSLLLKGQSCQGGMLCNCVVNHSRKWVLCCTNLVFP